MILNNLKSKYYNLNIKRLGYKKDYLKNALSVIENLNKYT